MQQHKLQSLLDQLLVKIVELELKAPANKAYQPVARELSQLHRVLFDGQKAFFEKPTVSGFVQSISAAAMLLIMLKRQKSTVVGIKCILFYGRL